MPSSSFDVGAVPRLKLICINVVKGPGLLPGISIIFNYTTVQPQAMPVNRTQALVTPKAKCYMNNHVTTVAYF